MNLITTAGEKVAVVWGTYTDGQSNYDRWLNSKGLDVPPLKRSTLLMTSLYITKGDWPNFA